ncbi:DUF2796 domain-containing protein [Oceanisphaera psychrotolerans]|uniref:Zinc-binding protein n=1 Tax=Oceanisphaera psychrotolerans TaxID=1414654 RepID=A0A1J4QGI6_9GAMM|nr:DUF2796 domain-containing protein [Oceanisphaera psychrotolerans]OIN13976.1 hypothetical protein BFR47_08665 [Oceanisphaera psychrotolerans]
MSLKPLALALPLLPFCLLAQPLPGVHEHGFGRLSLALDQQQLVLELLVPAADVVGFEHAPTDEAEQAQLTDALKRVQQADTLFHLSEAAACQLNTSRVLEEDTDAHELEEHADEPEHKHGHHENEHADEHHHEHHDDEPGHNDVLVQYRYRCQQPLALNRLSTTLFEQFPSLTRVELQGIVPAGQIATTLSPEQPAFSW